MVLLSHCTLLECFGTVLGGGDAAEVVGSTGDVAEVVKASVRYDGGVVGRGVGEESVGAKQQCMIKPLLAMTLTNY